MFSKDRFEYQNPYVWDKNSLLEMVSTFGTVVDENYFEDGKFMYLKNDDYVYFMTSYKLVDIFGKYGVIMSTDEKNRIQMFMLDAKDIKKVKSALKSKTTLIDPDILMSNSKESLDKIFMCILDRLSSLYNETYDNILKYAEALKVDNVTEEELASSIDNQLAGLDCEPEWYSYCDNGDYVYLYNNIKDVYALCKKDLSGNIDIRFLCPDEYNDLKSNMCISYFRNYWSMCSEKNYRESAVYYTAMTLLYNRLNNIKIMCQLNGYNPDKTKISLWQKLKIRKLKKKLDIKFLIF